MASSVVGALRVILGADTAQFSNGLKQADSRLASFSRKLAGVGAAIGASVTAAAVGLGVAIKGTVNEIDKIGKVSQKIGIPVEELSKLQHAADLSGVSMAQLTTGVGRLSQNLEEFAATGKGEAARVFETLGIEATNANGTLKSSTQIISEVADRFSRMEDGAEKTAFAMELFGRSGRDMIPMLNQGSAGLRDMMKEAEQLGLVIDNKTFRASERFNDNLTRLARAKDGVVRKITSALLPAMERLSSSFVENVAKSDKLRIVADGLARGVLLVHDNVRLLGKVLAVFVGAKLIGSVVGIARAFVGLAQAVRAVGIATIAMNAAKKLTIGRLTAIAGIIAYMTGGFDALKKKMEGLGDVVAKILPADVTKSIKEGLKTLGLDLSALTSDLEKLGDTGEETSRRLSGLGTLAPIERINQAFAALPPTVKKADDSVKALQDRFVEAIEGISLRTRELRGEFDLLAPGFAQAAAGLGIFNAAAMQGTVTAGMLNEKQTALNNALWTMQGALLQADALTPYDEFRAKLQSLDTALANGAISWQTYQKLAKNAAEKIGNTWEQASASIAGSIANAAQAFGDEYGAMAHIAKIAGAAQALINAYIGASNALAAGIFPANVAAAASVIATGLGFVATIKSAAVPSFSRGGSFMVPGGVSGVDNQIIPMALRSGEEVTVRTPEQAAEARASAARLAAAASVITGGLGQISVPSLPTGGDFSARTSEANAARSAGAASIITEGLAPMPSLPSFGDGGVPELDNKVMQLAGAASVIADGLAPMRQVPAPSFVSIPSLVQGGVGNEPTQVRAQSAGRAPEQVTARIAGTASVITERLARVPASLPSGPDSLKVGGVSGMDKPPAGAAARLAGAESTMIEGLAAVRQIPSLSMSSIPGFARGGGFTVGGGVSAIDNKRFMVDLASGEDVSVTRPGQAGSTERVITIEGLEPGGEISTDKAIQIMEALNELLDDDYELRIKGRKG